MSDIDEFLGSTPNDDAESVKDKESNVDGSSDCATDAQNEMPAEAETESVSEGPVDDQVTTEVEDTVDNEPTDIECIKETLRNIDEKIDYTCESLYNMSMELKEKLIIREVMNRFDQTIKERMSDIKLSATKTVLTSIANLREKSISMSNSMKANKDKITIDDALDNFDVFTSMLEEMLQLNDVVPFRDEVGSIYEYPKHNKVKVIKTNDISLDKTISRVISDGYILGDSRILPEIVEVYKYEPEGE